MSVNCEKGQKLKCVRIPDRHDGYFTIGKEYTVLSVDYQDDRLPVKMSCDATIPLWCEASAFDAIKDNGVLASPQSESVGDISVTNGGMSLRDHFAAAAASGYTSNQEWMKNVKLHRPDIDTDDAIAKASYEVADAMLAERAK